MIKCFDEAANALVGDDFKAWEALQKRNSLIPITIPDYCNDLIKRSLATWDPVEKQRCFQRLTLIYTVGAYFGLGPTKNKAKTLLAMCHLRFIARNAVDNSKDSIAIEALHCKITDSFRKETTNPNIAILKTCINERTKDWAPYLLNLSLIPDKNLKIINWCQFLAGVKDAKIKIGETDFNIYDVRKLSDDSLEEIDDYIQLLFPAYQQELKEDYYLMNPNLCKEQNATPDSKELFGSNAILPYEVFKDLMNTSWFFQDLYTLNLKLSFYRIMQFYGLRLENLATDKNKLVRNDQEEKGKSKWSGDRITKWGIGGHNTFRLTRILIALRCARLDDEADMLFSALRRFSSQTDKDPKNSWPYWKRAYTCDNYAYIASQPPRNFWITEKTFFLYPKWLFEGSKS